MDGEEDEKVVDGDATVVIEVGGDGHISLVRSNRSSCFM